MSKQRRKMYRILAWFFSTIIAAGTFIGCGGKKYGVPTSKYGPPPASGYSNTIKKQIPENNNAAVKSDEVEKISTIKKL